MPGHLMQPTLQEARPGASADLAALIGSADFTVGAATIVGIGTMGRQYLAALRALGVPQIRICSRSPEPLAAFQGTGIDTISGGIERLACAPGPDELGIIATPTASLAAAAERLASLGFRRLLIEKPVSLRSAEIDRLARRLEQDGVDAVCAYNRVAYPSCHEVRACAAREGITSCTYTVTERIKPDWPQRFPAEELARWGIANSLHVLSMAHGLIGLPAAWNGQRSGALPWHPSGAVFVGSGISERSIPFAYHADWGSTGRWSVEVHTRVASYRLCPLEEVFRKVSTTADWTPLPVAAFAPQVKAGIVEQVAAMLHENVRAALPLVSLREAAALTRFGEGVFGYR